MKQYEVRYHVSEEDKVNKVNPLISRKGNKLVYLQYEYAYKAMTSLLQNQIPAWIVESEWDDDIPF
mgnify:FL=1